MTSATTYLDWNATTPPHPAVIAAMAEASLDCWGNPSSVHALGRRARERIEVVRAMMARFFGAHPRDLLFTSGGTEANNLALADAPALITSRLEHPSVTRVAESLEAEGRPVYWLPVTRQGEVEIAALEARLATMPTGTRVAVQAVNHETGVLQPLREVSEVTARYGALLHVDAVQALGKLPPEDYLVGDSFSIAAHKIRGPKAIGAFIWRCGRPPPRPLLRGGSQQRGYRPGTLDPISVVGFGAAWQRLDGAAESQLPLKRLRDRLERAVSPHLEPNVTDASDGPRRLSHVASLYCPTWTGEELVAALDLEGICASSGSACSAGTAEPSPVIQAMLGSERAARTVRFSLGETTTEQDIDRAVAAIALILSRG